ncbi:hypothetical protein Ddc_20561 [Ditylenchus destructor]|nr:hypothetical protein Ddc_20561 [Ditylenchus destructor]
MFIQVAFILSLFFLRVEAPKDLGHKLDIKNALKSPVVQSDPADKRRIQLYINGQATGIWFNPGTGFETIRQYLVNQGIPPYSIQDRSASWINRDRMEFALQDFAVEETVNVYEQVGYNVGFFGERRVFRERTIYVMRDIVEWLKAKNGNKVDRHRESLPLKLNDCKTKLTYGTISRLVSIGDIDKIYTTNPNTEAYSEKFEITPNDEVILEKTHSWYITRAKENRKIIQ